MRFSRLAVLTALCAPLVAAFSPGLNNNRQQPVFPKQQDNRKTAAVGPLKVGEEITELARIVDLSSVFLLLAPVTALSAGVVAQAQKSKLTRQIESTEEELETIKDKIKSTDAQVTGATALTVASAGFVAANAFGLLPNFLLPGSSTTITPTATPEETLLAKASSEAVIAPRKEEVGVFGEESDVAEKKATTVEEEEEEQTEERKSDVPEIVDTENAPLAAAEEMATTVEEEKEDQTEGKKSDVPEIVDTENAPTAASSKVVTSEEAAPVPEPTKEEKKEEKQTFFGFPMFQPKAEVPLPATTDDSSATSESAGVTKDEKDFVEEMAAVPDVEDKSSEPAVAEETPAPPAEPVAAEKSVAPDMKDTTTAKVATDEEKPADTAAEVESIAPAPSAKEEAAPTEAIVEIPKVEQAEKAPPEKAPENVFTELMKRMESAGRAGTEPLAEEKTVAPIAEDSATALLATDEEKPADTAAKVERVAPAPFAKEEAAPTEAIVAETPKLEQAETASPEKAPENAFTKLMKKMELAGKASIEPLTEKKSVAPDMEGTTAAPVATDEEMPADAAAEVESIAPAPFAKEKAAPTEAIVETPKVEQTETPPPEKAPENVFTELMKRMESAGKAGVEPLAEEKTVAPIAEDATTAPVATDEEKPADTAAAETPAPPAEPVVEEKTFAPIAEDTTSAPVATDEEKPADTAAEAESIAPAPFAKEEAAPEGETAPPVKAPENIFGELMKKMESVGKAGVGDVGGVETSKEEIELAKPAETEKDEAKPVETPEEVAPPVAKSSENVFDDLMKKMEMTGKAGADSVEAAKEKMADASEDAMENAADVIKGAKEEIEKASEDVSQSIESAVEEAKDESEKPAASVMASSRRTQISVPQFSMSDFENLDPIVSQGAAVLTFGAIAAVGVIASSDSGRSGSTFAPGTKSKGSGYTDGLTRSSSTLSKKTGGPTSYLDNLKSSDSAMSSTKTGDGAGPSYLDALTPSSSMPKKSYSFSGTKPMRTGSSVSPVKELAPSGSYKASPAAPSVSTPPLPKSPAPSPSATTASEPPAPVSSEKVAELPAPEPQEKSPSSYLETMSSGSSTAPRKSFSPFGGKPKSTGTGSMGSASSYLTGMSTTGAEGAPPVEPSMPPAAPAPPAPPALTTSQAAPKASYSPFGGKPKTTGTADAMGSSSSYLTGMGAASVSPSIEPTSPPPSAPPAYDTAASQAAPKASYSPFGGKPKTTGTADAMGSSSSYLTGMGAASVSPSSKPSSPLPSAPPAYDTAASQVAPKASYSPFGGKPKTTGTADAMGSSSSYLTGMGAASVSPSREPSSPPPSAPPADDTAASQVAPKASYSPFGGKPKTTGTADAMGSSSSYLTGMGAASVSPSIEPSSPPPSAPRADDTAASQAAPKASYSPFGGKPKTTGTADAMGSSSSYLTGMGAASVSPSSKPSSPLPSAPPAYDTVASQAAPKASYSPFGGKPKTTGTADAMGSSSSYLTGMGAKYGASVSPSIKPPQSAPPAYDTAGSQAEPKASYNPFGGIPKGNTGGMGSSSSYLSGMGTSGMGANGTNGDMQSSPSSASAPPAEEVSQSYSGPPSPSPPPAEAASQSYADSSLKSYAPMEGKPKPVAKAGPGSYLDSL